MVFDEITDTLGPWLSTGQETGVIISSRVRLARNLRDAAFPGWAGEDECVRICDEVRSALEKVEGLASGARFLDMCSLGPIDKEILKERHLISNELAERGIGRAVYVAQDEGMAVMVNEEDHLRLQSVCPGMNLLGIWEELNNLDTELETRLDYAFCSRWGYLTACPTNVGTGLRASVMMHLSGLKLINEVGQVIKGLDKIGLAVRGLLGEGTEAYGNMFQISNQGTMGETEEAIVNRLTSIVGEVARHEQNARARLMEDKLTLVLDQVGRAYGALSYARILTSGESLDLLSALRLGVELGVVGNLTIGRINETMHLTQPGHLQKMVGKVLGPGERDEVRARLLRQKLEGVELAG